MVEETTVEGRRGMTEGTKIYEHTIDRLERMHSKYDKIGDREAVILLAQEIEMYRKKISYLQDEMARIERKAKEDAPCLLGIDLADDRRDLTILVTIKGAEECGFKIYPSQIDATVLKKGEER